MIDDLAAQVKELTVTAALYRVAPEHAAELADSLSFGSRLAGASTSTPGFDAHVAAAVHDYFAAADAAAAAEAATAEQNRAAAEARDIARRTHGQWTQADVDECTDPAQLTAAYHAGQLAQLGMPTRHRPGRREVARPLMPSAAAAARWRQMQPWEARRARAAWFRGQAQTGRQVA